MVLNQEKQTEKKPIKSRETLSIGAMKVLEALAVFQFLTPKQMVFAGVSPNINTVRDKLLQQLIKRNPPLIEVRDFGVLPKIGRLSRVYFLNMHGAKVLNESLKSAENRVYYPKKVEFANDYFHRIATIDFQIRFRNWLEKYNGVVWVYDNYYSRILGEKTSQTTVNLKNGQKMVADSVIKFNDGDKVKMFALEMELSRNTTKILTKIEGYISTIQEGAFVGKYDYQGTCPIIYLFQHAEVLKLVKQRLKQNPPLDFPKYSRAFLFNTIENLDRDFAFGWHFFDDSMVKLFVAKSEKA